MPHTVAKLLTKLNKLNELGLALSSEKDKGLVLEGLVEGARVLTHADAGTLFLRTEKDELIFSCLHNESLNLYLGYSHSDISAFKPIPLYNEKGAPNRERLVCHTLFLEKMINIPDAYTCKEYPLKGLRRTDKESGYHSQSVLTVPMKNHEGVVIGVLQLINRQDEKTKKVIPFSHEDEQFAASLASQAAIILTNKKLIDDQRRLFEESTKLVATAIDTKSHYTSEHCRRVPILTTMIAKAAAATTTGPLASFNPTEDEIYELEIAAWLHDCGKLAVPDYIMDKATKCSGVYDKITEILTRFEIIIRDKQLRIAEMKLEKGSVAAIEKEEESIKKLKEDQAFVIKMNEGGGEGISVDDKQRLIDLSELEWTLRGEKKPLLDVLDLRNLSIGRGTLNDNEREQMQNHAAVTHQMLVRLHFPSYLKNVAEIASNHHEKLNGKGYPRQLHEEQLSIRARILAIADVYEALTAADRPYKQGKSLSESLSLLRHMASQHDIDTHLFNVFMRERVFAAYAESYVDQHQHEPINIEDYLLPEDE